MKKAISFVLFINVCLITYSQNLVVNPGFEQWEKSNKPSGWAIAQNCLKDSVNIRLGNYSCRHEGGTKYLGQTLAIVPGNKYRLSFFYKSIITGTGNGCRIWCYWKNSEGNNLTDPTSDDVLRPSKYLKSEIWQQFSADFAAPAGASSFYLEVRTYQNSVIYFDDFVFEENVTTFIPYEKLSDVILYPNPAADYLIISNMFDLEYIFIQSITGTILWSAGYKGEQHVTIPVSGLVDGMYIVRIHTTDKIIIRKFIKKAK